MLPAFKASFEVANYSPSVEYLSEGGLYSGVFRKAFLYDKLASDGSNNTFICFEFLTRKEQKLAIFNLFVAKNNDFSYINKNGEKENYLGFRQLNAIMKFFGIDEFELQKIAKTNKKIYFLNEQQATLLLTYMKNSESVRNAKKVLVFAFYKMKEKLKNLEQEQEKARFKTLSDENQRLNSLNHHQKIGYKSQLAQQKEKYENKIKALKYDLDHKNELSFKRKLSQKELLELRKILARDYGMICIKEWEMSLFAEKIGKDTVFEAVLNKLEKELKYWKNYDEFEEKWKKILRK
ncbi:phage regulatory protein [Campylobacter jejuni]